MAAEDMPSPRPQPLHEAGSTATSAGPAVDVIRDISDNVEGSSPLAGFRDGPTQEADRTFGEAVAHEPGAFARENLPGSVTVIEEEGVVSEGTSGEGEVHWIAHDGRIAGNGQAKYRLLSSLRPKAIVTHNDTPNDLHSPANLSDLTTGAREMGSDAMSMSSERAAHPFPSPIDEDVRQFVLATGGGYGAADADARFVIGGEWRERKRKRGKWFSLRRMKNAADGMKSEAEGSKRGQDEPQSAFFSANADRRASGGGVVDSNATLSEAAEKRKRDQQPHFFRPELGSAGYSQRFRFLNDAELEEKRKFSGRRLDGDLLVSLDKIDNVEHDMSFIKVIVTLANDLRVDFDPISSRCYGKRHQTFDNRTRVRLDVNVVVVRENTPEKEEGQMTGTMWGFRENLSGQTCDVTFVEGSTIAIALKGQEIRKQEDALPQFEELLQRTLRIDFSVATERGLPCTEACPTVDACLGDILFQDTWMEHASDFVLGLRALGAGMGKVQYKPRRMCYDEAVIKELLGADAVHNPACGRLAWKERDNVEPASYVRIPAEGLPGWEETNPFLVRFLMERVWNMSKPRLIFSVTGGAKDFNMTNMKKDRLLLGLIEAAKAMDAWVITSGTSEGVMKLVGEARARYAVSVPLIGVTTWGTIGGRHKLLNKSRENTVGRQHAQLTPVDDYTAGVKEHRLKFKVRVQEHHRRWNREKFMEHDDRPLLRGDSAGSTYSRQLASPGAYRQKVPSPGQLEPATPKSPEAEQGGTNPLLLMRQRSTQSLVQAAKGWTELDQNHSHFVMIQDGTSGLYAREVKFRGHLESCLAEADGRTNEILASLKRLGMGWQGIDMSDERSGSQTTPAVCVCVQGGPGTVSTVMHAVLNETPVLLVKGSGNAADLIADAVLLRFGHENTRQLSMLTDNQRALSALIQGYVRQGSSLSGLCKDYAGLIEHLEDPDENLSISVQAIVARYFEKVPTQGLCRMMSKVLRAAQTGMCWIYDLNSEDGGSSDFSGSLLKCLLHGQRQKLREDTRQQLERDLQMVIAWDRKDILEQVLENSVAKTTVQEMQAATSAALHGALVSNRVDLVKVLLDHGASLGNYSLQEEKVMQHDDSVREFEDEEEAAEQLQTVSRWIELLRIHKGDAAVSHVRSMLIPLKMSSRQADWVSVPKAALQRALSLLFPRKPTYKQRYRSLMMAGRAMKQSVQVSKIDIPLEAGLTRKREWNRAQKFLLKMRWLYRDLLGEGFRYHMGISHPHLDLLLWSVVMNRQELALLFWTSHARTPMQSALTCALLYRKMAARSEVEPVIQKKMIEASREFEKHAVGVQQAAMEADMLQALEAVEFPLDLWSTGATAVDLAVAGGSMTFLELCCREALDRRFAGDLHPYAQQIGFIRGGCKRATFICIFSGGLLAPWLIKFVPPPLAENLRFSTQYRSMPEGYPYEPLQNKVISRIFRRYKEGQKLSRAEGKAVSWVLGMGSTAHTRLKLGAEHLGELWDPTFGYWEKILCFWRAPVTIYLSNVVAQVVVLSMFTRFLASSRSVEADSWHPFEYFLFLFFAASSITESLQVLLDGFGTYVQDFWNCIDVTAIMCFWTAGYFRKKCMTPGECAFMNDNKWMTTPYQRTASDDPAQLILEGRVSRDQYGNALFVMNGISKLFYALSLFFLWTRLLRILSVDKTLGPLVLIFRRMGRDALNFGIMWAVLFIAFSVAVHGTGVAAGGECEENDYEGECWESWWVIRTYFQAFSQPFFDDMTNYSSMIFLMFSWVVMNIIMVNLLIARMSSTYSRIEKQSEKEWMLDRYLATNEYMRHTTSIPIPFNVLPLLIDLAFFFLKQIYNWFRASKKQGWEEFDENAFSWTSRLTQHLSRTKRRPPSRTLVQELRAQRDTVHATISKKYKSAGGQHVKLDQWRDEDTEPPPESQIPDDNVLEYQRLSRLITLEETALMRENKQRLRINAFMESSRAEYMRKSHIEITSQSRIDRMEEGMHALLNLLDGVNSSNADAFGGLGMGTNSANAYSELENINNTVRFTQSIHTRNGFI